MGFFNGLRSGPSRAQPEIARVRSATGVDEKTGATVANTTTIDANQLHKDIKSVPSQDSDNEDELVHTDMQTGVQKVEAMAQVWPKWALYVTYAWWVAASSFTYGNQRTDARTGSGSYTSSMLSRVLRDGS